jgi:hypothetical protein
MGKVRLGSALVLGVALWGPSCSSDGARQERAPFPAPRAAAPIELDLGALAERARLAFRRDGNGFSGHFGHYTSVSQGLSLVLRPRARGYESADFGVEPTEIGRHDGSPPLRDETHVKGDGSIEIDLGPAKELRRNTPAGVLQEWTFEHEPPGSGPLEVRLRTFGPPFATETASGAHFVDPKSQLGVCYGRATWVDANGAKTAASVRVERGTLVIGVPEEVIERSAYPARLDPLLSPEFGIDNPVPVAANAGPTGVARAGNTFLVVWLDSGGKVAGARVSVAGQVLDTFGLQLGDTLDSFGALLGAYGPAVASNGTDFMVVYVKASAPGQRDLYGTRVQASNGAVLDPNGLPISTSIGAPWAPKITFGAGAYYAAWVEPGSTSNSIAGARLDPTTGQPMDGPASAGGTFIMPGNSSVSTVVLASNGSNALVAADGKGERVDLATGALLHPTPFTITGLSSQPAPSWTNESASALFDGTNYFVTWVASGWLRGARVTPTGVVLDAPDEFNQLPGGLDVCQASATPSQPRLLADGASRLLLTVQGTGVYGSRIDTATGSLLDIQGGNCGKYLISVGSSILGDHYSAALSPSTLLVVSKSLGTLDDPTTFALQKTVTVAPAANGETLPSVASNGNDFFVAWADDRNDAGDVFGARIKGQDGTVLDPTAIALSTAAGEQRAPAVASNGTDYFVVWESDAAGATSIRGTRVHASDGAVLDGTASSDGKQVDQSGASAARVEPAITSDGASYLVSYVQTGSTSSQVYALRYGSDGLPMASASGSPTIPVASSSGERARPAVSCDATSDPTQRTYVVTWNERSTSSNPWKLRFARIRAALGSDVDLSGKDVATINADSAAQLTSDGTNFFLVWDDYGPGAQRDLFGVRMDPANGALLDAAPISIMTAPFDDYLPSVSHDGNHYDVIWAAQAYGLGAVLGMRIGSDGKLLDGPPDAGGFLVSDAITPRARAASNSQGRVLVVFSRAVQIGGSLASRAHAIFVEDSADELDSGIKWDAPWFAGDAAPEADATGADVDATDGASGQAGSAGSAGTGAGGSAGSPASGGAGGSGGAATGGSPSGGGASGGAAIGSGAAVGRAAAGDDGGCGCRESGTEGSHREGIWLGLLLALAFARSRRR